MTKWCQYFNIQIGLGTVDGMEEMVRVVCGESLPNKPCENAFCAYHFEMQLEICMVLHAENLDPREQQSAEIVERAKSEIGAIDFTNIPDLKILRNEQAKTCVLCGSRVVKGMKYGLGSAGAVLVRCPDGRLQRPQSQALRGPDGKPGWILCAACMQKG